MGIAPVRTGAMRRGALAACQRSRAGPVGLNAMARPAAREQGAWEDISR
jgi:hypothetical protein